MADTPRAIFRIPPGMIDAARERTGQLDAPGSVLVRAGLAVLAGACLADALATARAQAKSGPKRPAGTDTS